MKAFLRDMSQEIIGLSLMLIGIVFNYKWIGIVGLILAFESYVVQKLLQRNEYKGALHWLWGIISPAEREAPHQ